MAIPKLNLGLKVVTYVLKYNAESDLTDYLQLYNDLAK